MLNIVKLSLQEWRIIWRWKIVLGLCLHELVIFNKMELSWMEYTTQWSGKKNYINKFFF